MTESFLGRATELALLNSLLERKSASLAVLKGRRRIGKSRLIEEFAKKFNFYAFSGLLPTEKTTAQSQRDEFARQLSVNTTLPEITADDWGKLFQLLADYTKSGRAIILLDEISWMGSKDADFLGKLKIAWDLSFKKNPKLILILCGSVSSWIEKNILASTGFLGRPTLSLTIEELPLHDSKDFWRNNGFKTSNYDKLKLLAVTGGVPRYLELINPKLSAEENIQQLCFSHNGILVDEFKYIFSDIFGAKSQIYQNIVTHLVKGISDQQTIAQAINRTLTGDISDYLEDLVLAGFVSRDYTWHLQTGKIAKLSQYRLKDNYVRFYLKYIAPNLVKIHKRLLEQQSITHLAGWDSIMGLQFENLVINNIDKIIEKLRINKNDIIFHNPFFQRKTNRQAGCQIDYLIQTKHNVAYILEIKFSKNIISNSIIDEVKTKINQISFPRHFSFRTVLVHVNGVADSVIDEDYFYAIIDFSELLEN